MMEDIDQHRDKRQKMEVDRHENADTMEVERTTQPTNHNRNADVKVEEEKEEKEEEEEDKIVVDSDNTTLDQLQEDMGDAFLLGRSSKALLIILFFGCTNLLFRTATSGPKPQFASTRYLRPGAAA